MRKIIIYQVNFDNEIEAFDQFEYFLHSSKIPFHDVKIEVFSGYDDASFLDATDIISYLGLDIIYRHKALNKDPQDLNEALSDILNLMSLRKYNILFLISHYKQARFLPSIVAKYYFKKKKEENFSTIPGAITIIDLEKEEFIRYIPDTILN
jgi:hypothetical protein